MIIKLQVTSHTEKFLKGRNEGITCTVPTIQIIADFLSEAI